MLPITALLRREFHCIIESAWRQPSSSWDHRRVCLSGARRPDPWFAHLNDDGYPTTLLPPDLSVISAGRRLAKLCLDYDASLIHTHFSLYDAPAWIAQKQLALRGQTLQVIWHAHSDFPVKPTVPRRAKSFIRHRIMSRSVQSIAVSEHIGQMLIRNGTAARRVHVVHNGIDAERATLTSRSADHVRNELAIPSDARVLLLFGWEPMVKGVDIALEAVAEMLNRNPSIVLAVVGTNHLQDFLTNRFGDRLPYWLRLLPRVEYIGDYYQIADAFLLSSRSEGFSYSVCEALLNGVPVIASDIPGVSWARRLPGVLFFTPGDSSALANAIEELFSWTATCRGECGEASRDFVMSEFGIAGWVYRIRGVYESILV